MGNHSPRAASLLSQGTDRAPRKTESEQFCAFHASDSASACCTRSICHPHVSIWFIQLRECYSHATKVCIFCFCHEWWYQSIPEKHSPAQSDWKTRRHLHPRLHFPIPDRNVNKLYVFRQCIQLEITFFWQNTLFCYSSNYLSLSNSLCNHNWAPLEFLPTSLHWSKWIYHGPITELIKG